MADFTNAVVAIFVELSPADGVGADGVPVEGNVFVLHVSVDIVVPLVPVDFLLHDAAVGALERDGLSAA